MVFERRQDKALRLCQLWMAARDKNPLRIGMYVISEHQASLLRFMVRSRNG